ASVLVYRWFERKRDPRWGMGWRSTKGSTSWLQDIGKGLALGTVLIAVVALVMSLSGVIHLRTVPAGSISWTELGGYIVFMAIICLNEEVLIRGYTQGLLRYRFGVWPAIMGSSLLFGLMHGLNPGALDLPLPLINAALAGVLLAVCRETSGALWLPFGVHWSWNYVQGSILGFEVSGTTVPSLLILERSGDSLLHGGSFGAEGSILTLIVMLIASAAVWHLSAKQAKRITD
ncbi:MAG: Abortive infection protein, partial [Paenibacillus sp.]|nr:Abortive infection protein [Paenibacillus sp.]